MGEVFDQTWAAFRYTVPSQINHYNESGFRLIGVYEAGGFCERYTALALGQRACVVQVLVPDPRPGDLICAWAEGEVTSERNTNTEIVSALKWSSGSGAIDGIEMSEENGENVDINRHHHKLHNNGFLLVPNGTPSGCLRFVAWIWGAFNGPILPQQVTIEQDYASLVVEHYRPMPAYFA